MKSSHPAAAVALLCSLIPDARADEYTNFIRQVQFPSGVHWDASVASHGERSSLLEVSLGGSRFDLWTVRDLPLTSYLLDTRFVGAFAPSAEVTIRSEDPYDVVPRTRADRPFFVDVTIDGLTGNPEAPASGQGVKMLRHVQSYGAGGVGEGIDRKQATLLSQATLDSNGERTFTYAITSVPAANLTKATGEERFSIFSLADEFGDEAQLASHYIQIWPMADATISGVAPGERVRYKAPDLTFASNDLYPGSYAYAQLYSGQPVQAANGERLTLVPNNNNVPMSRVITHKDYGSLLTEDGIWTIEILTVTPFGTDRLAHVTFEVDRTLKVNAMLSTAE